MDQTRIRVMERTSNIRTTDNRAPEDNDRLADENRALRAELVRLRAMVSVTHT